MLVKEQAGSLYLGKVVSTDKTLAYETKNLTTHAVCVGMTGSGKTGLGIALLEEVALNGIPALIVDPKGDLGNLELAFPRLEAVDFLPWIDKADAERKGQTAEQYAEATAKAWKDGLAKWGENGDRIKAFKNSVDIAIYTPASQAGIPLSILNSFSAPPDEVLQDTEALRDRILSTTSSLLGLLGISADPIKSREHILISTILDQAWRAKKNLDISGLIQQILKPPFDKVGVFDTDTFFPAKERQSLSMSLNNLLASPGFQAWMQGEPLDIQNLLYTKEGKPRLAILSIAHLSDSERMFFVTLLLNELLSWMRRQTGTSNLRALLYMDEIFGFFPPSSMPPSKTPMLTLLKQARAFGLGIMLATQNPVDLDYKGLSNCGTWFIGKLQTERDKARVLEGLSAASNGELNTAKINQLISSLGNRVFILRSVYLKDPLLFETRWTLSYLRGPLTLPQIQTLMSGRIDKALTMPPVEQKKGEADFTKPNAPSGVQEYFAQPSTGAPFQAKILGISKLHFVDPKSKVDTWQQSLFAASAPAEGAINWEESKDLTAAFDKLSKQPPANSSFTALPSALLQAKNYGAFTKSFAEYLYQTQTLTLFSAPDAKMLSKQGENEEDFRQRVAGDQRAKYDDEVRKVKDSYSSKMRNLQDRIDRAQAKLETKRSQTWRQILDALLSIITTLLGAMSGKKITKGSISQAGTSIRKAERIGKEHQDATQAEESAATLQGQLQDLKSQMDREVAAIMNRVDPNKISLEKTIIRPRKSDISATIALLWA